MLTLTSHYGDNKLTLTSQYADNKLTLTSHYVDKIRNPQTLQPVHLHLLLPVMSLVVLQIMKNVYLEMKILYSPRKIYFWMSDVSSVLVSVFHIFCVMKNCHHTKSSEERFFEKMPWERFKGIQGMYDLHWGYICL